MCRKFCAFYIILIIAILLPRFVWGQLSGRWETAATNGFIPRAWAASAEVNGKIYVIGGFNADSGILGSVQVYDPYVDSWSTPDITGHFTQRMGSTANVINGKIYVFGGQDRPGNWLNSIQIFDPVSDNWTTDSTIGEASPREEPASVIFNGKLYVIGGFGPDASFINHLSMVEVFDPLTNTWTKLKTKGAFFPRSGANAFVLGNKIYVVGGEAQIPPSPQSFFPDSIAVFDPATNTWSTLQNAGTFYPRSELASVQVGNQILVMGGYNGSIGVNIVQAFDMITNTWSVPKTTGLFSARRGLTANISGGKIFAIGGNMINTYLSTNEVFSPLTNDVSTISISNDLNFFPNPTNGIVSVSNPASDINRCCITNVLGETLLEYATPQASKFTLDLLKLSPGLYYARLFTPNSTVLRKIILQ